MSELWGRVSGECVSGGDSVFVQIERICTVSWGKSECVSV